MIDGGQEGKKDISVKTHTIYRMKGSYHKWHKQHAAHGSRVMQRLLLPLARPHPCPKGHMQRNKEKLYCHTSSVWMSLNA